VCLQKLSCLPSLLLFPLHPTERADCGRAARCPQGVNCPVLAAANASKVAAAFFACIELRMESNLSTGSVCTWLVHLAGATCCANQSRAADKCPVAAQHCCYCFCFLAFKVLAGGSPATLLVSLAMMHLDRVCGCCGWQQRVCRRLWGGLMH
jgi:hypothetical protein